MRRGTVRKDTKLKGKNEEVKGKGRSHLRTGKEMKKERTAIREWRKCQEPAANLCHEAF